MTMHEDEAPTQQCGSAGTKCIWRLMDQSQMSGRCNGRTVLKPGFGGDDYGRYDMDVEAEPKAPRVGPPPRCLHVPSAPTVPSVGMVRALDCFGWPRTMSGDVDPVSARWRCWTIAWTCTTSCGLMWCSSRSITVFGHPTEVRMAFKG